VKGREKECKERIDKKKAVSASSISPQPSMGTKGGRKGR
jgi:hypothetical protein